VEIAYFKRFLQGFYAVTVQGMEGGLDPASELLAVEFTTRDTKITKDKKMPGWRPP